MRSLHKLSNESLIFLTSLKFSTPNQLINFYENGPNPSRQLDSRQVLDTHHFKYIVRRELAACHAWHYMVWHLPQNAGQSHAGHIRAIKNSRTEKCCLAGTSAVHVDLPFKCFPPPPSLSLLDWSGRVHLQPSYAREGWGRRDRLFSAAHEKK